MAKTWVHGDIPTAADINQYGTELNTLNTNTPGYNAIPCILLRTNEDWITNLAWPDYPSVQIGGIVQEFEYRIKHTKRYLHFKGSGGKIADVSGFEPDVTLTPGASGTGVIDLDGVTWLIYGQWYKVQRIEAAWELDNA